MNVPSQSFSKNVFINCPFDDEYYVPLLRPLLFVVIYLGYNPHIASERFNSSEQRISKICDLIKNAKFSIHDISRIKSKKRNEVYRLNLSFELGIDFGCRLFNEGETRNKVFLILEKEKYLFHTALSDMSGVDIKNHNNNPEELIRQVRNWFVENDLRTARSPSMIWDDFNEFMADFFQKRKGEGFSELDLQVMPIREYISFIEDWLKTRS